MPARSIVPDAAGRAARAARDHPARGVRARLSGACGVRARVLRLAGAGRRARRLARARARRGRAAAAGARGRAARAPHAQLAAGARRRGGVRRRRHLRARWRHASGPRAPTRLAQAQRDRRRRRLGSSAGIPLGVATFTDRVLPNVFPTADRAVFDSTVRVARRSTAHRRARLARRDHASARSARSRRRLLHRGRAAPCAGADHRRREPARSTPPRWPARSRRAARVHVVVVRVGGARDRLYAANGRPGGAYRADPPARGAPCAQLVAATGGQLVHRGAAGVAAALRSVLGCGPTTRVQRRAGRRARSRRIVALASLIPLLVVLLILTFTRSATVARDQETVLKRIRIATPRGAAW